MGKRNEITLERIDETLIFKRGEYVSAYVNRRHIVEGKIVGISHVRREVKIGGVWYKIGAINKCKRPVIKTKPIKRGKKLSSIVSDLNNKFAPPGGWGDDDKVIA
jgi:hypothetical protein